jgi:hypothetical protein
MDWARLLRAIIMHPRNEDKNFKYLHLLMYMSVKAERWVGTWSSTYPVALMKTPSGALKVVKPSYKIIGSSSTYVDETWYYSDDIHVLIYLDSSLRGRHVSMPLCVLYGRQCDEVKKYVEKLWVEEGKSEREVEMALELLIV